MDDLTRVELPITREQFDLFIAEIGQGPDAEVTHAIKVGTQIVVGRWRVSGVQNYNGEHHRLILTRVQ